MGLISTIAGFCGFGVGISAGLVIGYYLSIYFQPSDVKHLCGKKRRNPIKEESKKSRQIFNYFDMEFVAPKGTISISMNTMATTSTNRTTITTTPISSAAISSLPTSIPSRYKNQKRRDWNTFCQYLNSHRPPLSVSLCSDAHVLEYLRYLDPFGKTKVHHQNCPFFGVPNPPFPCPYSLRKAWGRLDALIGRLRAAFKEHGGKPEANPFGVRAVKLFIHEVCDFQAKSRGISYEKKRKRPNHKVSLKPSSATQVTRQT